jgi:NADH-quinone oxidoreductase subunit M
MRWGERVPALILIVTLVGFGAWPRALTEPLNRTLEAVYPAVEAVKPAVPALEAAALPAAALR